MAEIGAFDKKVKIEYCLREKEILSVRVWRIGVRKRRKGRSDSFWLERMGVFVMRESFACP